MPRKQFFEFGNRPRLGRVEKSKKKVQMAQEQKCCVSDMGHLIPQIKSTTTTKTNFKQ